MVKYLTLNSKVEGSIPDRAPKSFGKALFYIREKWGHGRMTKAFVLVIAYRYALTVTICMVGILCREWRWCTLRVNESDDWGSAWRWDFILSAIQIHIIIIIENVKSHAFKCYRDTYIYLRQRSTIKTDNETKMDNNE